MNIPFVKLQGAGNDYIAIDGRGKQLDWSKLAVNMTRHHFGICSDGLLVARESTKTNIQMMVFNPDGSEAEMSGNGIRLFTKFIIDNGISAPESGVLKIETLSGIRTVWPLIENHKVKYAKTSMGRPDFSPENIGLSEDTQRFDTSKLPLEAAGLKMELFCLSIGNPHAVAIVQGGIEEFPLEKVGKAVENHTYFLNRINFEVVEVKGKNSVRARIFERGAGETLSSGTGSTASVIAATSKGLCESPVSVQLDGGFLKVSIENGEAYLEGPAEEVFRGTWSG